MLRPLTVANYRQDPLYPRIVSAVEDILRGSKVVMPVDVLIAMDLLTAQGVDNWRRGRVPYLERIITCNLSRLGRILRILRFHAHDLKLKPSLTVYLRSGSGPRQRLQFTKTQDPKLEQAYATHLVWIGKSPFNQSASKAVAP